MSERRTTKRKEDLLHLAADEQKKKPTSSSDAKLLRSRSGCHLSERLELKLTRRALCVFGFLCQKEARTNECDSTRSCSHLNEDNERQGRRGQKGCLAVLDGHESWWQTDGGPGEARWRSLLSYLGDLSKGQLSRASISVLNNQRFFLSKERTACSAQEPQATSAACVFQWMHPL